jgi:hypothetical protein
VLPLPRPGQPSLLHQWAAGSSADWRSKYVSLESELQRCKKKHGVGKRIKEQSITIVHV